MKWFNNIRKTLSNYFYPQVEDKDNYTKDRAREYLQESIEQFGQELFYPRSWLSKLFIKKQSTITFADQLRLINDNHSNNVYRTYPYNLEARLWHYTKEAHPWYIRLFCRKKIAAFEKLRVYRKYSIWNKSGFSHDLCKRPGYACYEKVENDNKTYKNWFRATRAINHDNMIKKFQEPDPELERLKRTAAEIKEIGAEIRENYAEIRENCAEIRKIHAETRKIHAETREIYAETREIYAETREIYAKTREIYAKTREIYAETREIYAETREIYAETREIYAETREIYAETREIHAETREIYAEIDEKQQRIIKFLENSLVCVNSLKNQMATSNSNSYEQTAFTAAVNFMIYSITKLRKAASLEDVIKVASNSIGKVEISGQSVKELNLQIDQKRQAICQVPRAITAIFNNTYGSSGTPTEDTSKETAPAA